MLEDFPLETQTAGGCLVVMAEERGVQDSLNLDRFPFCSELGPAAKSTTVRIAIDVHTGYFICVIRRFNSRTQII